MRGRTLFIIVCISLALGAVAAFALFEALHRPGGPGGSAMHADLVHEEGQKNKLDKVKVVSTQATHELAAFAEVLWYDAEFYVSKWTHTIREDVWPVVRHYAQNIVWPFVQHHALETVWPFLVVSFETVMHITGDLISELMGSLSGTKAVSGMVPQHQGDITPAMPVGQDAAAHVPQTQAFAREGQYPITEWTFARKGSAGYIEHVFVNGRPLVSGVPVSEDADLLITGWAGNRSGTRFTRILLTMCDKVIGTAGVHRDTPSVQRFVHKKLAQAGWTALLPAGVLPRCDKSRLGAFAVRGKNTAIALQGALLLPLEEGGNPARGGPFSPVVRPER